MAMQNTVVNFLPAGPSQVLRCCVVGGVKGGAGSADIGTGNSGPSRGCSGRVEPGIGLTASTIFLQRWSSLSLEGKREAEWQSGVS